MKTDWDLNKLYTSFDSKEFKKDMSQLESNVKSFNNWCDTNLNNDNKNSEEIIETYINKYEDLEKFSMLLVYSSLISSVDTENFEATRNINTVDQILTDLSKSETLFKKYLTNVDNLDEIINKSNNLKEYSFFIKENLISAKHTLSEEEEILYSNLKITGADAWETLRNQLTSTVMVDVKVDNEIKSLPLSSVRNLAYSESSSTRKNAYEAELKAYENIDKSCASALNSIKGEALIISKKRGYKSILDMTLENSRMDKEILDAMFSSIKDNLNIFNKYFKCKAEILGHKNSLPFYDIFAPISNANISFTYEEASQYVIKNFTKFSKELGDFAKNAFENNWIDALPKKGKVGGAFCDNIHYIKESRILSNFEGSFNDMVTLAHELGHAYHGECLKNEKYVNSEYSMPIAETASTFCETLIFNSALAEATDEEKFFILENDISSTAQVIVDIYSRFLFEDNFINKRKDGPLSVEEINEIMIDAQIKAYGNGLDKNYLHKYMWICKPHYYSVDENYYNFPYAYGLLFAKGLYSQYIENKDDFVDKYTNMLANTGKNNLKDIALLMDIDVTKKEFWDKSLKIIEKQIDTFVSLKK